MNKKTIITALLVLVAMVGRAQIHYRLEGSIILPQFGIRIVHKKVGSLTNILYLYR